jgi:hypothetical protein
VKILTIAAGALVIVALAGCDAYAAQRIEAESHQTVASAQLASTQALSATVGTLTAQNAALVATVTAQASAWQVVVVILAVALMLSTILVVAIVASRRRELPQAPVYILPASPTNALLLDDPDEWPESRARRRALRIAAPQDRARYQITSGR